MARERTPSGERSEQIQAEPPPVRPADAGLGAVTVLPPALNSSRPVAHTYAEASTVGYLPATRSAMNYAGTSAGAARA